MERYTVSSLLIGHLYATRRAASDVWILIDAAAFKTVFTTMLHSVWLKLAQAHPSQAFLFAFKLGLCFIDGTYHGYIILKTEELDPLREYNSAPHIYLTDEHINPQDSSSNKRSGCLAAGKTQQLVQRSKLWSVFVPESSCHRQLCHDAASCHLAVQIPLWVEEGSASFNLSLHYVYHRRRNLCNYIMWWSRSRT